MFDPITIEPAPAAVVQQHAETIVRGPSTTVTTTAAMSLAETWEAFVPVALADVFPKPKGPVPAVVGTSGQVGRWDVPGRGRTVHLGDGSAVYEEITGSDPSGGAPANGTLATFSYRVTKFSGPIGLLTSEAHGTWRFEEVSPWQTRIEWTYTFVPKSWLASLPLRVVLATFWRAYMRDGIENVREIAERRDGAAAS